MNSAKSIVTIIYLCLIKESRMGVWNNSRVSPEKRNTQIHVKFFIFIVTELKKFKRVDGINDATIRYILRHKKDDYVFI